MVLEIKVLVIEDDPVDFEVLKRLLSANAEYNLIWVKNICRALDELKNGSIDVVLLDLSLPDSEELESIPLLKEVTYSPIVVLTGLNHKGTALEALKNGAQDYLIKGQFEADLLVKSISYAIERNRLLHELDESRLSIMLERETRRLEYATPSTKTPKTAGLYGQKLLKDGHPVIFRYAVGRYEEIFDQALEQRKFKIEYDVSARLRLLADQLGTYKAIPRDIVEIHTVVLNEKTLNLVARTVSVYNEEGRYLLTGLIGYLCSFYRRYSSRLPPALPLELLNESVSDTAQRES